MIQPHRTIDFWRGTNAYVLPDDSLVPGAVITFGSPLYPFDADEEFRKPNAVRAVTFIEPEALEGTLAVAKRPAYGLLNDPAADSVPWAEGAVYDRHEHDVHLLLLGRVRAGDSCSYLVRPLSVPQRDHALTTALGPFVLERVGPSLSMALPGQPGDDLVRLVAMAAVCGAHSLAYLAVHGRVHRDVTMNNLMLGRPVLLSDRAAVAAVDHVTLGDFGHSSSRDGQVSPSVPDAELPRQRLGTSFVQAPSLLWTVGETERDAYRRADLVTDLFALGVSLHAAALDADLPWTEKGQRLNWRRASTELQDVRNFAARVREGTIALEPDANRLEELRSSPLGGELIDVITLLLDESRLAGSVANGQQIVGELADRLDGLRRRLPGLLPSERRPLLPTSGMIGSADDLTVVPVALGGDPFRSAGPLALGAFLPEQPVRPPRSLVAARWTRRVAQNVLDVAIEGVVVAVEEVGDQIAKRPALAAWLVSLAGSIAALVWLTDDYGELPGARWWWIAGGAIAGAVLGIAVLVQPGCSFSRGREAAIGLWAGCVGFIPALVGIGWRELIRQRLLWWSPDIDTWHGSQIAVWLLVSGAIALVLGPPRPTTTRARGAADDGGAA